MATELIQLAVGDCDFSTPGRHAGVVLRDVTAPSITAALQPALGARAGQIDWMEARVGPLPVRHLRLARRRRRPRLRAGDADALAARHDWFTDYGQGVWDPTMLHELSHMWFGDSVAPYSWSDLWLNEGHASWYEFIYAESTG